MNELIKTRTLSVRETAEAKTVNELAEVLTGVPGVKKVELDNGAKVRVQYDLAKVRWHQICDVAGDLGFMIPNGFWPRWRRGWIDFTETNEYDNMSTGPAPCCSNPEKIIAAGREKH
ncbi:MAG: hypothetical protein KJ052_01955 [Candidatus Hydrogenedentes bacterium]|nr:hypothetical protein [Candidatus Hydrogenedentota bacterium]